MSRQSKSSRARKGNNIRRTIKMSKRQSKPFSSGKPYSSIVACLWLIASQNYFVLEFPGKDKLYYKIHP